MQKLNKRITIQEYTEYKTDEGMYIKEWKDKATVWASIKNLHGGEFFQAQAVNSKATCKMRIRYIKGLDTNMRIKYNEKSYNIVYLDDINERHEYIEVLCEVIE